MTFEWKIDVASILTFLAIIVALFGREFVTWLKRPKLSLIFQKDNKSFFHKMDFPLFEHGGATHYSNGINCLFRVDNSIRNTWFIQTEKAEQVETKITYVYHENKKHTYHPTNLNWSGSRGENAINIISGSHHYLDFIRFYNYENEFLIDDPENPIERKASAIPPDEPPANVNLPNNKIYFELWVPQDYGGIKKRFDEDGTYRFHMVLNGKNCGPKKYVVTVKWNKKEWNDPAITFQSE
jgi:hypothetical protein